MFTRLPQQINFTGNVTRGEGERIYFITEEAKETVSDFSKGIIKKLWFYFRFNKRFRLKKDRLLGPVQMGCP